jgi:hypothetical protein
VPVTPVNRFAVPVVTSVVRLTVPALEPTLNAVVPFEKVIAPDNVALPDNVPDSVPPLIVGVVRVLLVKVSDPARVASVPVVGSVTLVVPVVVNVSANAPEVVRLPARDNALLFGPMPVIALLPLSKPKRAMNLFEILILSS